MVSAVEANAYVSRDGLALRIPTVKMLFMPRMIALLGTVLPVSFKVMIRFALLICNVMFKGNAWSDVPDIDGFAHR